MEDKKLNFDQPLLSTRRYPTASNSEAENTSKKTDNALSKRLPLPKYISELKSGPVRNPGTVPFVWEQMPGRPKNDSKSPRKDRECHAITAPKLPPAKFLNVKQETWDGVSEGAAVNRSKGKIGLVNSQNVQPVDKIITKEVCNEVEPEEAGCSDMNDDDSIYVDAADTLSRCESFFMTCSMSGISGQDGADFRLPETNQIDAQARDFMIGRFLPAAKAMVSEMPQHSDRRHVPKEQQTEQTVNVVKLRPPNLNRPRNLAYYIHSESVEDIDDDDDDNDVAESTSHNLCGLLPRLCLQNSLCLLNPVPGIRKQPELPIKSVRTKIPKTAIVSSCETQKKCEKDTPFEKRLSNGPEARGIHEDKNRLPSGSIKLLGDTDRTKFEVSSLFRFSENRGVNGSHKERTHEEIRFVGIPDKAQNAKGHNMMEKDGSNLKELLLKESNDWAATAASSPMVDRTLYEDSIHTLKPTSSNYGASDMTTPDYNGDEVQMLLKSPKIEVAVAVDSVLLDGAQSIYAPEKAEVQLESSKSPNFYSPSSSDRSVDDVQLDVSHASTHCKDLEKDSFKYPHQKMDEAGKTGLESQLDAKWGNSESIRDINSNQVPVSSSKFIENEMINIDSRFPVRQRDRNCSDSCTISRLLLPPLPKTPSESWLKRVLPAVASRSSSKTPLATSIDRLKAHNFDPKWEIIVRTTNEQHGHLQFSKELLAPIPEA